MILQKPLNPRGIKSLSAMYLCLAYSCNEEESWDFLQFSTVTSVGGVCKSMSIEGTDGVQNDTRKHGGSLIDIPCMLHASAMILIAVCACI